LKNENGSVNKTKTERKEKMKKLITIFAAVVMLLVLSSTSEATITTFDSSGAYATIGDLQTAYSAFMGTIDDMITFEEFSPGSASLVGDYYLAGKGVRFLNEVDIRILQANGGAYGGWQQGYVDGKPTGNMLYNKISNANPLSELTVLMFNSPVKEIGSFVSNSTLSYTGPMSTEIKAYDSAGNLLTTVTAVTRSWGNADNIEGYWGIKSDIAIAKVTFLAPTPPPQYADVTTLDDIAWVVPEPATMLLLGLGGIVSLIYRKK
jgi:hypothetical protein